MNLQFEERPYAGKNFRPRPEILLDEPSQLLIVATPWGPRAAAKKVIDRMVDYLSLAREDREATAPFERLSCLSTQANNLRVAALLANEALYREDNRIEYRSGVELFAAIVDENELVWLQAGNPQILLSRLGRKLLPLGSQIDLAYDMSGETLLPPLPSQLLGLDTSLNLSLNSFRARIGDKLVLLSHSQMPENIFAIENGQTTLEAISAVLAKVDQNLAFWLGILTLTPGANETQSTDEIGRHIQDQTSASFRPSGNEYGENDQ
jgi:hypothetical protein